ncbi:N-acetylmuramoyl-L-alanine amidase [Celeribacter sp.]|uniref:N-acetylmuramoyl-L-alanine amidase n=1 Tax=Celeribacter sp. TaxID=1890673 RepID=UPI003A93753B
MIGTMVRMLVVAALAMVVAFAGGTGARAQDRLTALTPAMNEGSALTQDASTTWFTLRMGQRVPFRVFTLNDPMRMVVDFSEVDWTGFDTEAFNSSQTVEGLRVGVFRPGWSRMVLDLAAPLEVVMAEMKLDDTGAAVLRMAMEVVPASRFSTGTGVPADAQFPRAGKAVALPTQSRPVGGPLKVVLDPGHGGIDPGAVRDGVKEADLMLTFAQELRDALVRAGGFEVTLTRTDDTFVPLETRITRAREAGADVFLSLHADAIPEGHANGASVYTLSPTATDAASQMLAERHDRADLLSGVDLTGQDDVIAGVLMDMARTETEPRTDALADALVAELQASVGMHKRPRQEAGFSVLKAADIPSVLVELGFLSSQEDRDKLADSAWRAQAAWAVRDALIKWKEWDAARTRDLRQ